MPLETGDYISDLVATNPTGSDPKSAGDDHFRLIKKVLSQSIVGFDAVIVTGTEAVGGTANDYVVTVTPSVLAYTNRMILIFQSTHDNTGAATVKINSLATVALTDNSGGTLSASAITQGSEVMAIFDGTGFRVLSGNFTVSASFPSQGGNAGKYLTTNGTSALWGVPFNANYQEFLASGSWTKPSVCNFVYVECVAGGGGGRNTTAADTLGGGGGGEYVSGIFRESDLASSVTVTVGAGGSGGANGGNNSGTSGGNSSFGAHVVSIGGFGATGATTAFPRAPTSGVVVTQESIKIVLPQAGWGAYSSGGTTPTGGNTIYGGGGGGGTTATTSVFAGGVSALGGNGGDGVGTAGVPGGNGVVPGGGGGSSCNNGGGGNGANGRVRVWSW